MLSSFDEQRIRHIYKQNCIFFFENDCSHVEYFKNVKYMYKSIFNYEKRTFFFIVDYLKSICALIVITISKIVIFDSFRRL